MAAINGGSPGIPADITSGNAGRWADTISVVGGSIIVQMKTVECLRAPTGRSSRSPPPCLRPTTRSNGVARARRPVRRSPAASAKHPPLHRDPRLASTVAGDPARRTARAVSRTRSGRRFGRLDVEAAYSTAHGSWHAGARRTSDVVRYHRVTASPAMLFGFPTLILSAALLRRPRGRFRLVRSLNLRPRAMPPRNASRAMRRLLPARRTTARRSRLAQSLSALDAALALAPDDGELALARAETLSAWGRSREARDAYLRAQALGVRAAELHAGLGAAYAALGQFDNAISAVKRAILAEPSELRWRHFMGTLQEAAGNTVGAIGTFESVIAEDPSRSRGEDRIVSQPRFCRRSGKMRRRSAAHPQAISRLCGGAWAARHCCVAAGPSC